MTRRFLFFFVTTVLVTTLIGCSGGGSTSTNAPPPDIYGTWKLTRIRGGISGSDVTPDYVETITFITDNTATIRHNGTVTASGPFTSVREQTDVQQQPLIVLTLPGGTKLAILDKTVTTLTLTQFSVSDRQIFDYSRQASL